MVEYGCILTGMPAFVLFMRTEGAGDLRAVAIEGMPDGTFDVRLRPIDIASLDLELGGPCVVEVAALGSADLAELCASHGYAEAWVAPLVVEGMRLKGLLIGFGRRQAWPHSDDLGVFRLLASQATSAVWAAERYELERKAQHDLLQAERRVAVTLQENFIHSLPAVDGLEVATVTETAYEPELVGGDFHDIFSLSDGRVVILLGDVEGKGVRAAGMTETVRTAVGCFALIDAAPAFMLRKINELLLKRDASDEQLVTLFVLTVNLVTRDASYASAGHPAPLVVRPSSWRFLETDFGLPLGTFPCEYMTRHITLAEDDCVVLFTDGLTEAKQNGEILGEQGVLDALGSTPGFGPHDIVTHLRDTALEFAGRLEDDLQILAFRLASRPGEGTPSSWHCA